MSFNHQLVNRCQLRIIKLADMVRLNIWHVHGVRVLKVFKSLRDKDAQNLQVRAFNGVKDF